MALQLRSTVKTGGTLELSLADIEIPEPREDEVQEGRKREQSSPQPPAELPPARRLPQPEPRLEGVGKRVVRIDSVLGGFDDAFETGALDTLRNLVDDFEFNPGGLAVLYHRETQSTKVGVGLEFETTTNAVSLAWLF